jgi:hypothetical protein
MVGIRYFEQMPSIVHFFGKKESMVVAPKARLTSGVDEMHGLSRQRRDLRRALMRCMGCRAKGATYVER